MVESLITPNKLVEMLILEVSKVDFSDFKQLQKRTFQLNKHIKNKEIKDSEIEELEQIVRVQVEFLKEFEGKLPKIKRISEILEKIEEKKIKRGNRHFFNCLKEVIKLTPALLMEYIELLEIQLNALKKKDFGIYSKASIKMLDVLKTAVRKYRKIGVELIYFIDENTYVGTTYRRTMLLVIVFFILPFLVPIAHGEKFYNQSYSECERILNVESDGDILSIGEAAKMYLAKDVEEELSYEIAFEEKYGVQLVGDYVPEDVVLLEKYLNAFGNFHSFTKMNTIVFLEDVGVIKSVTEGKNCFDGHILGFSQSHENRIWIVSVKNMGKEDHAKLFFHELAHQIHNDLGHKKEFDKEWMMVHGGYARAYGTVNEREDVATVYEEVMFAHINGKSSNSIGPYDRYLDSFRVKVEILKEFGLLPSHVD